MKTRKRPYVSDWLQDVPEEWPVPLLRLVTRVESGHTPSRGAPEYWIPDECTIPWFSLADIWQLREGRQKFLGETKECISPAGVANSAARILPPGTVVLSRTASVGFSGIMPRPMATTQDFVNFVCGDKLLPDFLLWVLRGMKPEFERLSMGSTHMTIYMPDLLQFRVPLPPTSQQAAIADFLDRKTAALDILIEKKERLSALLAEKRAALIHRAVTGALNSSIPRKDSGLPWIGQIPAHWQVRPLRYLVDETRPIMYGIVLPGPDVAGGVPIVKASNCRPARLRLEFLKRTTHAIEQAYARSRLRCGDVVIAIRGSVGSSAIVPDELTGANLTQDAARLAPSQRMRSLWLYYLTISPWFSGFCEPRITGATIKGLNIWDLSRVPVPDVPLDEQVALEGWISQNIVPLEAAEQLANTSVDRLREYREALITAAVTGQLEVRVLSP